MFNFLQDGNSLAIIGSAAVMVVVIVVVLYNAISKLKAVFSNESRSLSSIGISLITDEKVVAYVTNAVTEIINDPTFIDKHNTVDECVDEIMDKLNDAMYNYISNHYPQFLGFVTKGNIETITNAIVNHIPAVKKNITDVYNESVEKELEDLHDDTVDEDLDLINTTTQEEDTTVESAGGDDIEEDLDAAVESVDSIKKEVETDFTPAENTPFDDETVDQLKEESAKNVVQEEETFGSDVSEEEVESVIGETIDEEDDTDDGDNGEDTTEDSGNTGDATTEETEDK